MEAAVRIFQDAVRADSRRMMHSDQQVRGPYESTDATVFERYRRRLWRIAYGMLGSAEDADDLVQEAYLRWYAADTSGIAQPAAWLVTTMTRLSIDRLRRRKVERNAYTGPWLPSPLVSPIAPTDQAAEASSELSLALLLVLERLTPEERTAFLLREVFGVPYREVAAVLDCSEAACRQLVHRARKRVRSRKPKYRPAPAVVQSLVSRFTEAVEGDDYEGLISILASDASLVTDGGGKVWAARRVVHGADRVARAILGAARKRQRTGRLEYRTAAVNGSPGIVTYLDGIPVAATAFDVDRGRIYAVLRVLNPEKLARLPDPGAESVPYSRPSS